MSTVNVMDYVPSTEWAAIENFTSTYDATTAIQTAFDFSCPRKVVNFPAGQLNSSGRAYFNMHNIRLRGDGCIWQSIGANMQATLWIQGYAGWEISGIRFYGNTAGRLTPVLNSGESIIVAANCWNFAMEGLDIESAYADGIQLGATSSDASTRTREGFIKNVRIQACGRNAISFGGCRDIIAEHVHTYDTGFSNPQSGFALEPAYGTSNENICIMQPLAHGHAQHGLYCSGSNATVTIVGGSFHNNGGYGISKGGNPVSLVGIQSFSSNSAGDIGV